MNTRIPRLLEKAMPALLIPDLDETVLTRLQARACQSGRTIEEEARAILAEAPSPDPFWEQARRLRERLAATGRTFSDSAELIREDRDR
jgi:plasmid stability protein